MKIKIFRNGWGGVVCGYKPGRGRGRGRENELGGVGVRAGCSWGIREGVSRIPCGGSGPQRKRWLSPLIIYYFSYSKTNIFLQNIPLSKVKLFGYLFFNNFPQNTLKHKLPKNKK